MNLHADAIAAGTGERPLGYASIAMNEVPRVAPLRVGKSPEHLGKTGSHCVLAGIAFSAYVWAG